MRLNVPGLTLAACALIASSVQSAEQRLWINAQVNGTPAKVFLDTGAVHFYLFRPAAERFGLKVPEPSGEPWEMFFAKRQVQLQAPGFNGNTRPVIVNAPDYVPVNDTDGFLGWKMIRNNVVQLNAGNGTVSILKKLPPDVATWRKVKIRRDKPSGWNRWDILALETPPPTKEIIIIDTGNPGGVGLPAAKWQQWKAENPARKITRATTAMPSAGVFTHEQSSADELRVGPMLLRDVPVEEAEPWSRSMARHHHGATLGLAALQRLDIIVDAKRGAAYIRTR